MKTLIFIILAVTALVAGIVIPEDHVTKVFGSYPPIYVWVLGGLIFWAGLKALALYEDYLFEKWSKKQDKKTKEIKEDDLFEKANTGIEIAQRFIDQHKLN